MNRKLASHAVHLLDDVLPDLGEEHSAVLRIPAEALRIAKSVCVNLTHRLRIVVRHERVARRHSVLAVRAVVAEWVDAKKFSVRCSEILRHVQRIAAATAVGEREIEQAVVR